MALHSNALTQRLPLPPALVKHHTSTLGPVQNEWAKNQKIPQVLLFTGPSGTGKRSFCTWLAQWILCKKGPFLPMVEGANMPCDVSGDLLGDLWGGSSPSQNSATKNNQLLLPCGECPSCQRALHGNWVDFAEILREEDSETLKIEQFRSLKASQGFSAHEGGYRIFLIPEIERMTVQAANSMLKLLEEPPRDWVFFLTANDSSLVLPTILSRCQIIRLRPLDIPTLLELLEYSGVPAAKRTLCAELAQGSWGKALAFSNETLWNQRKLFFEFLQKPTLSLNPLIDWAAQDLTTFGYFLDQMESIILDFLNGSFSSSTTTLHLLNEDGRNVLLGFLNQHGKTPELKNKLHHFLLHQSELIAKARAEGKVLNKKILAQNILLPWLLLQ